VRRGNEKECGYRGADHETTYLDTGMSWEQEQHLLKTRCAQGRGFRQVYLTFSESGDLQAPHLQAIFQQCRSVDKATEGMEVWAFPRERVPSHEQLIGWAEGQIRYERDNGLSFGFESSVEFFLMMYSKADSTLPQVRSPPFFPFPAGAVAAAVGARPPCPRR
jgi:hypothetical protein